MRFREHRGSLEASLATTVEVDGRAGLLQHIRTLLEPHNVIVADGLLRVQPYAQDKRTGWDTHIVHLVGYGVVGFTDEGTA